MNETPIFESEVETGVVPGGAVGVSVDCEGVGDFALIGKVQELRSILLLDKSMEEASNCSRFDVVRVGGAYIWKVGVRVVEGDAKAATGTAAAGP